MAKAKRRHWTLDDIPWEQFDASRADPDILKIVKAASMVEANGGDYAEYLCSVFPDDPGFQEAARAWAVEEVQHGHALARWAKLVDPDFDFESSFERFRKGVPIPVTATTSIRGSRSAELVARCIVETGTSSYYIALMEATEEPALKAICRQIAADEMRHYKLFYDNLTRYLELERIGPWKRVLVAASRIQETEDDELAYAFYIANEPDRSYDRKRYSRAYARRAYALYRPRHVARGISMALKASGLTPNGRLSAVLSRIAYRFLQSRSQRLERAGA